MPKSVRKTIRKLIDLRAIDEKLAHLARRIEDAPRILTLRREERKMAEDAVVHKQAEITAFKLETKNREGELKNREEEIKKQEVHLLTTKKMSNEEYSAHQKEIRRLKGGAGTLEEAILGLFDRMEEDQKALSALERERAIREREFDEFKKEVEKDIAAYNAEIEKHKTQRAELAETVDLDAFHCYERVLSARDGAAIVEVEGHICCGCHMTITPNDLARLGSYTELVFCKSCQRILFIPDSLA